MTLEKYYFYLILKLAGAKISVHRLRAATSETTLFNDAIELIGQYNAKHIGGITELESEYYEVKALKEQFDTIDQQEKKAKNDFGKNSDSQSNTPHESILGNKENLQSLLSEKGQLLDKKQAIQRAAERTKSDLLSIQHEIEQFHALDGTTSKEITDKKLRLDKVKIELSRLKDEMGAITNNIEDLNLTIQERKTEQVNSKQFTANQNFNPNSNVTGLNKHVASLSNQKATIQEELSNKYQFIGRHLFTNSKRKEVKSCIKENRYVLRQAKALKKSIILNQKLGNNSIDLSPLSH